MGVGRDISTLWYFTGGKQPGNPGDEPWLAWLTALANETRLPMVFSGSYTDYEFHVTYVTRTSRCMIELIKRYIR